jgi:acyl-CoA thioesterase I
MIRIIFTLFVLICSSIVARAETFTILALGDSLTAGLGLEQSQAFPAKLEAALKARGKDVKIINAGVSGDTAAQGEQRLDWALTDDVDAAIIELGANDALRGLPPEQAEKAMTIILDKLAAKKLPVLLTGMLAPPNLGPDYAKAFEGMYQRLAQKPGVIFYPFFLDGVAANAKLNQSDGIHPTAEGVDVIVTRMLPYVEKLLAQ